MSATKIAIVYHSFWGHVATLAEEAAAGAKAAGVQVDLYTFGETLSDEVLGKLYANKSLGTKYPAITPETLAKYDGVSCPPVHIGSTQRLMRQLYSLFLPLAPALAVPRLRCLPSLTRPVACGPRAP